MTLPSLAKTWQFSVNQTVTSGGSGNLTAAKLMRTIKNSMKGFASTPWTVSGSSNAGGSDAVPTGSAGMDGVDRWTVDTDIASNGSNSRHPWIVLRQTGIATNYEICFEFQSTGSLGSIWIFVSPSAGFTGGTTKLRPTATDEITISSGGAWHSGADATHQAHIWQSSDGECTRVLVWRAGTNLCTVWIFDKPSLPPAGWTNPSVSYFYSTTTGIAITYANLSTGSTGKGKNGTTLLTPKFSGEGDTTTLLCNVTSVGTIVNDFDSNWPIFSIGLYENVAASSRGKLGKVFDLWWKPSGATDGDTFPNDSNNRQFVCMGCLILPWTSDSTAPLLT